MKFGVWGLDGGLFSQLAAFLIKTGPFRTGPRPRTRIKGLIECFKLGTQTLLCEAALPVVPWGISQQHQHPLGRKGGGEASKNTWVWHSSKGRERESQWNNPMPTPGPAALSNAMPRMMVTAWPSSLRCAVCTAPPAEIYPRRLHSVPPGGADVVF